MTPEEQAQYEDEFADLDPKLIQIQILSELQAIRVLLEETDTDTAQDSAERVECNRCGWTGSKDERKAHARDAHKAPADMLGYLFTPQE